MPPLAEPEAVDLFCARAELEPTAEIAELCRRLDSLPLAVELAAARTRALSPPQILERLAQRLDLLRGGRDADPRQQTLRATIEWSYDLLTEPERQLFRRLSVFAGGSTLEAAEAVCDADLDPLQSLVDKSLLRFSEERYWQLETIREYAVGAARARGARSTAAAAPGLHGGSRRGKRPAPAHRRRELDLGAPRSRLPELSCRRVVRPRGRSAGRRRPHPRRDLSVSHLARSSRRGPRVGRGRTRCPRPALRAWACRDARRRRRDRPLRR